MSEQSFTFLRPVDRKLTRRREGNFNPFVKPTYIKKTVRNRTKSRGWLRRLCCMYKLINTSKPKYFTDFILKREIGYNAKNVSNPCFNWQTESLKNSFFQYAVGTWWSFRTDKNKFQTARN